jgi:hypothetical protein
MTFYLSQKNHTAGRIISNSYGQRKIFSVFSWNGSQRKKRFMNQQHPFLDLEKQIQALQEEFRSTVADLISENQELKYWACYDSSTGDMRSLEDLRQIYED